MKCPNCSIAMKITEREDVEIDSCPRCRGVWLERGELEKIVARIESPAIYEDDCHDRDDQDERRASQYRGGQSYREAEHRHDGEPRYRGKRREGFLSNLFDLFGD